MTAEEHNKFVGFAQLGYAAIHLLGIIVMMGFMSVMFMSIYGQAAHLGGGPPPAFLALVFVFVGLIQFAFTIPSVVAGYALLKRRPWAKVAGIVGGVVAAMSFPIGTAVAVYTFWFLFGEPGRQLYDNNKGVPPPPPHDWSGADAPS